MKKSLLALFLFVSALTFAETECDIILTTNSFQIPCAVVKIGDREVQYRECSSTIDKLVIISVNNIRKIYLSDGTIMDYTQGITPVVTKVERQANNETTSPIKPNVENVGEQIKQLSSTTTPPQQQTEKVTKQPERSTIQKPTEEKSSMPDEPKKEAFDIIITTDANKIEAKITEVSKSEIRYKEKDNIDGPTFVLETADVHSILYANGKVVVYNQQSTSNTSTSTRVADVNRRIKYTRKETDTSCICTNVKIEVGEVYNEWKKWLDYINIVKHINIHKYRSIYIFPIDITQIRLTEQSDNQYFSIAEALESFSNIIRESIFSKFNHLNVIVVDTGDEVQMQEASIGLCLRFDEFELINKDSGIQKITLSGVMIDNANNHLFDFKQRRLTVKNRPILVNLQKEFKNFAEDICRIFGNLQ